MRTREVLQEARLCAAYLARAHLTNTDLTGANLYKAKVTPEQWNKAISLKGATLPHEGEGREQASSMGKKQEKATGSVSKAACQR